jgi:hypothetical protein
MLSRSRRRERGHRRRAADEDDLDCVTGASDGGSAHLRPPRDRAERSRRTGSFELAVVFLNPNDADILTEMADALVYRGRPREAIEMIEKAMRLNPFYPDWYLWVLGGAHYAARDYEKAIQAIHRLADPSEGRCILDASYAKLRTVGGGARAGQAGPQTPAGLHHQRLGRGAAGCGVNGFGGIRRGNAEGGVFEVAG